MREWIPAPSTARGRLALRALDLFAERGYAGVGVGELAAAAGVTTGSLYHHFGSKLGLYAVVRAEAEARVLDRMEGAAAARAGDGPGRAALLVGFDHAAGRGFARLLAEPHPDAVEDPVRALLVRLTGAPLGHLLAAAWRAALAEVAHGADAGDVRAALAALLP